MFVCLFVYRFDCFCVLIFVGHQENVPLKILWRFYLIWLRYLGSKNVYLFYCLFVCLLICFLFALIMLGPPQEVTLKIWWRSGFIWLRWLGYQKRFIYLFVCLFVNGFVCFCFNHLGTPTGSFPESFVKIPLDLAVILRI